MAVLCDMCLSFLPQVLGRHLDAQRLVKGFEPIRPGGQRYLESLAEGQMWPAGGHQKLIGLS